jgi:hypothetical protein
MVEGENFIVANADQRQTFGEAGPFENAAASSWKAVLKGPFLKLQKPRARWSRNDTALAYRFRRTFRGKQHLSNAFNMDFSFFCALGVRVFPLPATLPLGHVIQKVLAFFEHP